MGAWDYGSTWAWEYGTMGAHDMGSTGSWEHISMEEDMRRGAQDYRSTQDHGVHVIMGAHERGSI